MRRREMLGHLRSLGILPTGLVLGGCDWLEALFRSCPEDASESGGVDWIPDVLHPVFYGFSDHTFERRPVRLWYPSFDGSPQDAPILKVCLGRWPVVLFLHGQEPDQCTLPYFRWWNSIPAVLARCGYVVAVPSRDSGLLDSPQAVTDAANLIDWVRGGWVHRDWVDARRESTCVAGHSRGAVSAAAVAREMPWLAAYVGLSGGNTTIVKQVAIPTFLSWCLDGDSCLLEDNMSPSWDALAVPKVKMTFRGEHFDYQRPALQCEAHGSGPCTLMDFVTAELMALFIARHCPVPGTAPAIPPSLVPPTVSLTSNQQLFAGGHLQALAAAGNSSDCDIDVGWSDSGNAGSRHIGA